MMIEVSLLLRFYFLVQKGREKENEFLVWCKLRWLSNFTFTETSESFWLVIWIKKTTTTNCSRISESPKLMLCVKGSKISSCVNVKCFPLLVWFWVFKNFTWKTYFNSEYFYWNELITAIGLSNTYSAIHTSFY